MVDAARLPPTWMRASSPTGRVAEVDRRETRAAASSAVPAQADADPGKDKRGESAATLSVPTASQIWRSAERARAGDHDADGAVAVVEVLDRATGSAATLLRM
jgi:hypothetical protein